MHVLNIVRTVLLSVLCAFSLIVLGILSNFTSITSSVGFYYHAFALGIAVSAMTILFVGTSVVIDLVRRGAFTSLVWAELAWVGLLWVLWVATAGSITSLGVFTTCDYYNSEVESNCRQYQAVQAFSWLNWLISLGWFITLLVLAIISATKGNSNIWFQSVTDVPFFGNGSGASTVGGTSEKFAVTPSPGPQQYPPQQPQVTVQPGYAPQQPQGYPVPQQQPVGYAPQQTYNNTGSTQPAYPQV